MGRQASSFNSEVRWRRLLYAQKYPSYHLSENASVSRIPCLQREGHRDHVNCLQVTLIGSSLGVPASHVFVKKIACNVLQLRAKKGNRIGNYMVCGWVGEGMRVGRRGALRGNCLGTRAGADCFQFLLR